MRLLGYPLKTGGSRGQAIVEFSLVILVFLTLIIAIVEFSFLLNAKVGVTYTAQDAAQLAAEQGNNADADFVVLQQVEQDMAPPINRTQIVSVSIFWTNQAGTNLGADTYTRGGTYKDPLDATKTVPYAQTAAGYLPGATPANRCVVNSGIGCATGHTTTDWIGVTITYKYAWFTPFPSLIGLGGAAPTFTQTTTSRMEPVL